MIPQGASWSTGPLQAGEHRRNSPWAPREVAAVLPREVAAVLPREPVAGLLPPARWLRASRCANELAGSNNCMRSTFGCSAG
ncbi:hypothetical protein DV515_00013377 [Chloebia gouldiae]|uniref:Uncharacterized protein n=1 Tax=Chloebia gouldiae TaxID=44316 RepID=A0A3L8S2K0_CHLGU|nr:hypothetical protein DV515_00013377 [Chloebia gouldiae]